MSSDEVMRKARSNHQRNGGAARDALSHRPQKNGDAREEVGIAILSAGSFREEGERPITVLG